MKNNFIFKLEKKELENNIEISIFSINENSDIILEKKLLNYTFYISKKEFELLNINSDKILIIGDKFKSKDGQIILQIEVLNKELYDYVISESKSTKFTLYEQDLSLDSKYLIDNNISLLNSEKSRINLKYVSIDIESIGKDLENQEIILISSYCPQNLAKVYINIEKLDEKQVKKIKETKNIDFEIVICNSEKEMLEKFKNDIISLKPQAIIGWNVIDFDFKVIKDRMKLYNVEFKFSEYEGDCKLKINKDFFKDSSLDCPGLLIFDIIQILKTNYINFEDYKLNTVAKEILKDEKIDLFDDEDAENEEMFEDKIAQIEYLYKNNSVKLIEYNFKDSLLVSQIVEKLDLINLMIKRSEITNTPLQKVKSPIATLDIMYLKELHKRNIVASSNFNFNQSAPIEGAFVISPEKGFYEDIFVMDFKSLYPSIIMTFNIDPFSYDKTGEIIAPNGARFNIEPAILPKLINTLYLERDIAKKEKDKIKSYALKITMNSFYGAVASPKSRFHNRDVGGAITAFGREIIQKTKLFIENMGHKVIYGDTDSLFIKFNQNFKNLEEKKEFGKKVQNEINVYFKGWVESEFKQKSYLNIEFEKLFSKFFIASKKRYVGFDEMTSEIKYVGMEAIRGDWTALARNFQMNLIKQIFEGKETKEIEKFIIEEIKNLKNHKYDSLLIYSKKITKQLNEYTKMTPPHVKAAREIKNLQGRTVKYVMVKEDGAKHISLINDKTNYDYEHYIEKQLKGVSDDILEALNIDFDKIVLSQNQKSLNRFF